MISRRQQVLSDNLRAWWVITNRYRKPEGEVQAELISLALLLGSVLSSYHRTMRLVTNTASIVVETLRGCLCRFPDRCGRDEQPSLRN